MDGFDILIVTFTVMAVVIAAILAIDRAIEWIEKNRRER